VQKSLLENMYLFSYYVYDIFHVSYAYKVTKYMKMLNNVKIEKFKSNVLYIKFFVDAEFL